MYTIKRHTTEINVEKYVQEYVDVDGFLEFCKECPNYSNVWACPPFDFNPLDYWHKYNKALFIAEEIIFDEAYAGKTFDEEKLKQITEDSLYKVKQRLSEELYDMEKAIVGSISLSAGSCQICEGKCAKRDNISCKHPDKIRYSIEALGGNVGLTISKLMGIEIEWIRDGVLPTKFVLVCGLLMK